MRQPARHKKTPLVGPLAEEAILLSFWSQRAAAALCLLLKEFGILYCGVPPPPELEGEEA
jgi:hypothetical protein